MDYIILNNAELLRFRRKEELRLKEHLEYEKSLERLPPELRDFLRTIDRNPLWKGISQQLYQKNNVPLHTKVWSLTGTCFLDARSAPQPKGCGFVDALRHNDIVSNSGDYRS